jgi:hypothetical protein
MNRESLLASLRQIQTLAANCIADIGEKTKQSARKTSAKREAAALNLPDRILELREKGFFGQPKTAQEIKTKLNPSYPCEADRVAMAALRLMKKRKLRKASKKVDEKNQVAYVW